MYYDNIGDSLGIPASYSLQQAGRYKEGKHLCPDKTHKYWCYYTCNINDTMLATCPASLPSLSKPSLPHNGPINQLSPYLSVGSEKGHISEMHPHNWLTKLETLIC